MKKKLSGMTLVEVITAVAIIFLVSAAAYAGICTAGKFMVRGADIRAEAEKSAENLDKELRKEDYIKAKYREIKNKYKRKYELFYTQIGPAYANMFIKSVMMFDIVHFDEEFEEQYNILNNG